MTAAFAATLQTNRLRAGISQRELAKKITKIMIKSGLDSNEEGGAEGFANRVLELLLSPDEAIGRQIERIRTERGWTQGQLADEIGKILHSVNIMGPPGKAAISKTERGKRRPDAHEVFAAAIALRFLPWDILPLDMRNRIHAIVVELMPDPLENWRLVRENGIFKQFEYPGKPERGIITIAGNPPKDVVKFSCANI